MHTLRGLLLLVLVAIAAGCNTPPPENLKPYQWVDDRTAIQALCQRSSRVHSLSSEANLTLTRSNGESVRLDGAIVMRLPDSVRMRAWKFGQAVFDLTLTPDGLWIEAPPDPDRRGQIMPASLSAAKMARAWAIMAGEFFCAADAKATDDGSILHIERIVQGQRIVCDVQRNTLTPRKYHVFDADGAERFTLTLSRYAMLGDIPWPVSLSAKSDGGDIAIELKDLELNGDIAPNAFVPPKKAEKIP